MAFGGRLRPHRLQRAQGVALHIGVRLRAGRHLARHRSSEPASEAVPQRQHRLRFASLHDCHAVDCRFHPAWLTPRFADRPRAMSYSTPSAAETSSSPAIRPQWPSIDRPIAPVFRRTPAETNHRSASGPADVGRSSPRPRSMVVLPCTTSPTVPMALLSKLREPSAAARVPCPGRFDPLVAHLLQGRVDPVEDRIAIPRLQNLDPDRTNDRPAWRRSPQRAAPSRLRPQRGNCLRVRIRLWAKDTDPPFRSRFAL